MVQSRRSNFKPSSPSRHSSKQMQNLIRGDEMTRMTGAGGGMAMGADGAGADEDGEESPGSSLDECMVCSDHKRDVLFLPCGHICVCSGNEQRGLGGSQCPRGCILL